MHKELLSFVPPPSSLLSTAPEPVLLGDVAVVAVHGELLRVEDVLVARVAEELLVALVEGARVQRHAAVEALDAPPVVRLAVRGHHLRGGEKDPIENILNFFTSSTGVC